MRLLTCTKILQAVSQSSTKGCHLKSSMILPFLKVCPDSSTVIEYELQLNHGSHTHKRSKKVKKKLQTISSFPEEISAVDPHQLIEKFETDCMVTAAYYEKEPIPKIKFKVSQRRLMQKVFKEICDNPEAFWRTSPLIDLTAKQKVIVEFSSPNIAKPFHMGHLRSTIIGNFIANLADAIGHEVIKINYLGDWGTQFGLLKYGYDLKQMTEKDIADDPINTLYKLYVWINSESEKSPQILEQSKRVFSLMEQGKQEHISVWKTFRDLSITAYEKLYRRLNVTFDEYHGESMYPVEQCEEVLRLLEEKGLLKRLQDGRKVFSDTVDADTNESDPSSSPPPVTLVKSDGSSLYITRDIAAAIHRFKRYAFDRMIYVVDMSQCDHFNALKRILAGLNLGWAREKLIHVPFGRIQGMSTRKGTAVFLKDVLDEAKDLWIIKQGEDSYTSFNSAEEGLQSADVAGVSAVMVAFLARKRMANIVFNWDDVIPASGKWKTGSWLQYTHCRLVRLERTCGVPYNDDVLMETLVEPEALNIVRLIIRFDEVLLQAHETFESTVLVKYLNDLSNAINTAYGVLRVNKVPVQTAQERLKLFKTARHVLVAGMNILGLKPLERM